MHDTQIGFPAALLAAFLAALLLAVVWSCVRPRAAAVLAAVLISGVIALVAANSAALALWMGVSVAAVHFYFVVLPNRPNGGPSWCEVRPARLSLATAAADSR